MTTPNKVTKKTIYLDADDEITGIIDKVVSAKEQVVALVVPKRAAVFASVVNLKLLKRAASQNGKKIALITSDKSLLPLAGLVGVHTAATLSSKPFIPTVPGESAVSDTLASEEAIEIKSKSSANTASSATEDTISVDKRSTTSKPEEKVTDKKPKKQKVPDFRKFRLKLIIGIAILIVLLGFGYWAFAIAPNATVYIKGETNTSELNMKITASTEATELNEKKAIVPAAVQEVSKTETEKVPTTGEKNNGNKASGTVSLRNCSKSDGSVNIPAGTGVSSGKFTFIIEKNVKLDPSLFSGGGACLSDSKDVGVLAEEAGKKYNIEEESYNVAGFSGVEAEGSAMTGGTDDIVKVVSQDDVDKARANLDAKLVANTQELKTALKARGYIGLEDTLKTEADEAVATPEVDTPASEVTVSVNVFYTMLGLDEKLLENYIKYAANKEDLVDTVNQSILAFGLSKAQYQLGASDGNNTDVNISTNIVVGPEINEQSIKEEIIGLKRGVAEEKIKKRPGITEVIIETKPFWNYSIPSNKDKITITIEGANDQDILE